MHLHFRLLLVKNRSAVKIAETLENLMSFSISHKRMFIYLLFASNDDSERSSFRFNKKLRISIAEVNCTCLLRHGHRDTAIQQLPSHMAH